MMILLQNFGMNMNLQKDKQKKFLLKLKMFQLQEKDLMKLSPQ